MLHSHAFGAESLLPMFTTGRAVLRGRALFRNIARLAMFRSMTVHSLIFGGYKPSLCKKGGMLYFL